MEIMALALVKLFLRFQLRDDFTLATHNASYVKGKLIQALSELYRFERYLNIKFSPRTNGVVDIKNAKIVIIGLNRTESHKLVGTIMNYLNMYPSNAKVGYILNKLFMHAPLASLNTFLEDISGLA
eukprot:snap_masked-scaffold_133-processed-gene-0.3-mRNA-1 protein AED:1.00 eAED:1.00 QI:0/0/0/0/1/1/2/0/125